MNKLDEAVTAVINQYVYGNNSSLITHLMETDEQFSSEYIVNGEWYEVETQYEVAMYPSQRELLTRSQLDKLIEDSTRNAQYYEDYAQGHGLEKTIVETRRYVDYLNSLEPIDRTPTYWNEVDEWFAGKLIQRGAVVMMNDFGAWWGRDSGLLQDSEDLIAIAEELMQ